MSIARLKLCKRKECLLVVSIVEGAICDAHVSLQVMSVAVLSIAVQKRQCGCEISLLQKVTRVWQFQLVLRI